MTQCDTLSHSQVDADTALSVLKSLSSITKYPNIYSSIFNANRRDVFFYLWVKHVRWHDIAGWCLLSLTLSYSFCTYVVIVIIIAVINVGWYNFNMYTWYENTIYVKERKWKIEELMWQMFNNFNRISCLIGSLWFNLIISTSTVSKLFKL